MIKIKNTINEPRGKKVLVILDFEVVKTDVPNILADQRPIGAAAPVPVPNAALGELTKRN